jgi:hypothetical protein
MFSVRDLRMESGSAAPGAGDYWLWAWATPP